MEHRVRAAGIFTEGNRILLVCHRDPVNGDEWWIPPGGGVEEGDGSIIQTAQREIFEETGLKAELSRICYIREYRENSTSTYHLELFMPVEAYSGALTITNIPEGDLDYGIVKGVDWLDRAELEHLVVWPEWLKEDWFWEDAGAGFPETRYTGVQHDTLNVEENDP
jgi:8-oxo-dGTP diphosphatase